MEEKKEIREKKMQFRLTEDEYKIITTVLKDENISDLIRNYLLAEVKNKLDIHQS